MPETERRENCKMYQKTVDGLEKTMYDQDNGALKRIGTLEIGQAVTDTIIKDIKSKMNTQTGLQVSTLILIAGAIIKLVFFGS